ncbi:MAG: cupin domain-containing protein [Muribaculaceae bacterium]|nr:cupin domain-containing protein [Muribaculaceae bacterium]
MDSKLENNTPMDLARKVDYSKDQINSLQVVNNANGSITVLALDKEVVIAEHKAPDDVLVQVLEGAVVFKVEGTDHRLEAGQFIRMTPNTVHAVYAPECTKLLLTKINA